MEPKPNPFATLFHRLSACPLKPIIDSAVEGFSSHAQQALSSSSGNPFFRRITQKNGPPFEASLAAMAASPSTREEVIEERLAGVPVYALSNSADEFVLVSGKRSGRSLGLFCFKEDDAAALLEQMRSMDDEIRRGSRVVPVALNKVVHLKASGVAFRFIPDSAQVAKAIELKGKENVGESIEGGFHGVPVFQSKSLFLRSQNKRYHPLFFRKEDLEESLYRASHEQGRLKPASRHEDIQVNVLEEIVEAMKGSSSSQWEDVVFVPPGFNVSTHLGTNERS